MVNKSRAAGSFLGGITNNLGVVGIALGLGALFIFRDKISDFFQKGFESLKFPDINLGDVNLPEIKFPEFPEITFPEFPDFTNIFAGFQDQLSSLAGQTVDGITIPADTTVNPDGTVSSSTPPTFDLTEFERQAALDALEINRLRSQLENELAAIPASEDISGAEFAAARNAEEFRRRQEAALQAALGNQNVQTDIEGNQFSGGGVSFIGGSVTETPIRFLSLGQIIDRFNVSASQAADIRARALDDFGDFDFGTNTGSGIGNIPIIQNVGAVSDQQFQGLTAQEIALRLTGGNISNF